MTETLAQAVLASLNESRNFNSADQVAPTVILWPDSTRQWEAIATQLTRQEAAVLILGGYMPSARRGPAIWIRGELAEMAPDAAVILYLPGISRSALSNLEQCPGELRPLAELQFRGNWWLNGGEEWTAADFLTAKFRVHVRSDEATQEALALALAQLGLMPTEELVRQRTIDVAYLNTILVPDSTKRLLLWMDGEGVLGSAKEDKAFASLCRSDYHFDAKKDGVLSAVQRLGERSGKWDGVWKRFAEAPSSYPGILERLRTVGQTLLTTPHPESWPQQNDESESDLVAAYVAARNLPSAGEVRARVAELEAEHGPRRSWVWARLGKSPMADASRELARLAALTASTPAVVTLNDLRDWYITTGHLADDAVLRAIACVPDGPRRKAVEGVVAAIYRDWVDATARRLQDLMATESVRSDVGLGLTAGECAVFVDGLRFDVGQRLKDEVEHAGLDVELRSRIASIPSLTSSGKPAVAALDDRPASGSDFTPRLNGKSLDAGNLRAAMTARGVQSLASTDVGDPTKRGWTETADLDALGHKVGIKLADRVDAEVAQIADRVRELLECGWRRVHVVTDHGWLLVPGGLNTVHLDVSKTVTRKARCAELAEHVGEIDQPVLPWSWDEGVRVAIPLGISAFEAGHTYQHGGVSLQETITPYLIVSVGAGAATVQIDQAVWKGLRCRVAGEGELPGAIVEMRSHPADSTSVLAAAKPWDPDGVALLVADDDRIGEAAFVVVLDSDGHLVAQQATVVGG